MPQELSSAGIGLRLIQPPTADWKKSCAGGTVVSITWTRISPFWGAEAALPEPLSLL